MSADASGFRSQSISRHGNDPQSQNILYLASEDLIKIRYPDSKVSGDNIGPICGRQDPGGPRVGPMNFAIWVCMYFRLPYPLVIYLWLPLLSVGPLASWISIKNTSFIFNILIWKSLCKNSCPIVSVLIRIQNRLWQMTVKFGRALKKGEHRVKVYQLQPNEPEVRALDFNS